MNVDVGRKVLGIGMDLVEVERIAKAIERQGERFLDRVYTAAERAYCETKRNSAPFFAVRFAAKEAVAKAFGTGIGGEIGLLDIEVGHHPTGAPLIRLHGNGAQLAERRGVVEVLVTLTHTEVTAGATVVLQ